MKSQELWKSTAPQSGADKTVFAKNICLPCNSVVTYDLITDRNGRLYFECGVMFERVYLDDFKEVA